MPADCWIIWDSVVSTHVFSDHLISEEARRSYLLLSWDISFMVHDEVRGGELHGRQALRIINGGSSLW
jgi:hypothetical protein